MIKNYLIAPGPTPVPPRVLLAMAQPIIHHRTPQFGALFAEAKEGLKQLFRTRQDVLVLSASGSGAMEAALTNCFSPGEEVLVVNGGKFGERWLEISRAYGLRPVEITVPWGQAVDAGDVKRVLDQHPGIRGVLIQAIETSTTAMHPVREVAAITRDRDTLLIVDGITAVGVVDLPMDDWHVDVLVTGSQKALMLPPGLAFLALSERAWARTELARLPRYYFDLRRERDSQANNTTAYTPAISLVRGLRESLAMIFEEGLAAVYARHDRLTRATRAAALALEMQLVAPASPGAAATGIFVPAGIDGGKLVAYLRDRMGVTFGGGQGKWKGKVARIAHIGYMGTFDTIVAVAALEMALQHFGRGVELGRGVAAAQRILMEALPAHG